MTVVHSEGCQRQFILLVNPVTRRISYTPSFRRRWDCPACLEYKFGKKVGHIAQRHKRLVAAVAPHDSNLSREAAKIRAGYMSIAHVDMTSRTIITTRRLKPEWDEAEALAVLGYALNNATTYGVTRMSYNNLWRPDDTETDFIPVDTKCMSWQDTEALLERAGFKDKWMGNTPVEDVMKRLFEAMDEGVTFRSNGTIT